MTGGGDGDREALLRYVERFALVLRESGMPPMPARVFAYALADDADRYTAGELAEGLRVSPAAISGAVRYLVQAGLLGREREPGTRGDLYCLYDEDVWARIYTQRFELLRNYEQAVTEGIDVVGPDRPGGRRLAETRDFFAFLRAEMPGLIERWREHKATIAGQRSTERA